ncbi:hypothetical protein [Streptomyces sp. NPDC094032]|uniref:hypothetical protein n=1 Tax=Streptomyces sp. NPDC094032 TaxID=3155308 RepID=UPI00332ECC93
MAYVPQDLLDRVAALEREVRTLRGRAQMRPALNEILNGNVRIGEGGRLICEDPNGRRIFVTGQTTDGDWAVGIGRSTTGTAALTVGDEYNGSGAGQMIRTWNRAGEVIMMDDAWADRFLGRPWMPFPMYPTANSAMVGTTSWQYAWVGRMPAQNAVAVLNFSCIASAGGQARVTYVAPGSVENVIETFTLPTNTWVNKAITVPLDTADWGDQVLFQIEHRNAASTGAVETRMFGAYTRNTFDANEVPDPPRAAATSSATTVDPAPVQATTAPNEKA